MALFKGIFLWLCLFSPIRLSPTPNFLRIPESSPGKEIMEELDGETVTVGLSKDLSWDDSANCVTVRSGPHTKRLHCITVDLGNANPQTTSFEGTTILPNSQKSGLLSNYIRLNTFATTDRLFSEILLKILNQSETAQRALGKMIKLHYQKEFKPKTTISLDIGLLEKLDRLSLLEELQFKDIPDPTQPAHQRLLQELRGLRPSWFKFAATSSVWEIRHHDALYDGEFIIDTAFQQIDANLLPASEILGDAQRIPILSVYKVFKHMSTYSPTLDGVIFKGLTHPDADSAKYRWQLLMMLNYGQANLDAVEITGKRPNFLSKWYADPRFSTEIEASKEFNRIMEVLVSPKFRSNPDQRFRDVVECFRLFVHYNTPGKLYWSQRQMNFRTLSVMINYLVRSRKVPNSEEEAEQLTILLRIYNYLYEHYEPDSREVVETKFVWPTRRDIISFLRSYPGFMVPVWKVDPDATKENHQGTRLIEYGEQEAFKWKKFTATTTHPYEVTK
ncbi:hypothetical protein CROQUDRAFT_716741 [Cronartium quercuum f. sp. fusiforme G11]|uniref:Uncharacterized protein n=1 Tax=Cronartium quercuum f. sp. fusiforme G11 TaxID=708437 RepID=A0A9P6NHG1_9BASI|nr:hypothetical protein CROQUDRAFT_716741 [Cronartium quercuum f. sp. fusiforme G11]